MDRTDDNATTPAAAEPLRAGFRAGSPVTTIATLRAERTEVTPVPAVPTKPEGEE